MDQAKIGKFIAERRKNEKLTQMQLAEKLNITDRAVSKWETGKAMPDSSIMLELCGILNITVNDLLSGEIVTMENYNKAAEHNLIEIAREKEQADRRLLFSEIIICALGVLILLAVTFAAVLSDMPERQKVVLVLAGIVPFLLAVFYGLRLEQVAGYYECAKCGHRYVPSYKSVLWAAHLNRTRYMRCPKCRQKSWQRKVLEKAETAPGGEA